MKGHLDLFVVVADELLEHLFHLLETKSAHEPQRPSLKGDDGRHGSFELFGSVEDGAISSDGDDVVNEGVMLCRDELVGVGFGMFDPYFVLGACVGEVEDSGGQIEDDCNCSFNLFENLIFFDDPPHHQDC